MASTTVSDPSLDALVPVTPRWRAALAVALGLVLLVGAGASATLLRPGVIPGSTSGGGQQAPTVTTTIELEGGALWQRVESVTGPDVAAAWLTRDDPLARDASSPVTTLPTTLHHGQRAWLVIRWSSPCGDAATVRTIGPLGTVRDEHLPSAFTAAGMLDPQGLANAGCSADG